MNSNKALLKIVLRLLFGGLLVWVGQKRGLAPGYAFDALTLAGALIILHVLWKKFFKKSKRSSGGRWLPTPTPGLPGRLLPAVTSSTAVATPAPVDIGASLRAWETAKPSALWQAGSGQASREPQPTGSDSADIFGAVA